MKIQESSKSNTNPPKWKNSLQPKLFEFDSKFNYKKGILCCYFFSNDWRLILCFLFNSPKKQTKSGKNAVCKCVK